MLIFSNYFFKKTFGTARGFGTGKSIGPRYATPTILIFWPKIDEVMVILVHACFDRIIMNSKFIFLIILILYKYVSI